MNIGKKKRHTRERKFYSYILLRLHMTMVCRVSFMFVVRSYFLPHATVHDSGTMQCARYIFFMNGLGKLAQAHVHYWHTDMQRCTHEHTRHKF